MTENKKKLCAYCAQDKKLTKEHVIPSWFINLDRSPSDLGFSERAPNKFVNEIVVKDVCEECNNHHLSKLDDYGKMLHEKFFSAYVFANEEVKFEYDFQTLAKWLIKCSYNSARINSADLETLRDYARLIISDQNLPDGVIIFCSLIAPSKLHSSGTSSIAGRNDTEGLYAPSWFRIGAFRVPDFDSIDYSFRTIIIKSFAFHMMLPKLNSKKSSVQKRTLLSKIKDAGTFGVQLKPLGQTELAPPIIDAASTFRNHVLNNPLAYELDDQPFSKYLFEDKPERISYLIPRDDIESGRTDELENFFLYITSSRQVALLCKQKIDFSIDGYNNDSRELYQIDEVVRYVGKLNKIFPYWLFFQDPEGHWLKTILACLSQGRATKQDGTKHFIEMEASLLGRHINRWFLALNEFCHKHAFGETMNRKISADFSDLIKSFVSTD